LRGRGGGCLVPELNLWGPELCHRSLVDWSLVKRCVASSYQ